MKYVAVLVTICHSSQVLGVQESALRVPERIFIPICTREPLAVDPFTLLEINEAQRYAPPTGRAFEFSHPFDPNATQGLDATLKRRHPEILAANEYVCVFREKETRL
jgi:hypothetical protein